MSEEVFKRQHVILQVLPMVIASGSVPMTSDQAKYDDAVMARAIKLSDRVIRYSNGELDKD